MQPPTGRSRRRGQEPPAQHRRPGPRSSSRRRSRSLIRAPGVGAGRQGLRPVHTPAPPTLAPTPHRVGEETRSGAACSGNRTARGASARAPWGQSRSRGVRPTLPSAPLRDIQGDVARIHPRGCCRHHPQPRGSRPRVGMGGAEGWAQTAPGEAEGCPLTLGSVHPTRRGGEPRLPGAGEGRREALSLARPSRQAFAEAFTRFREGRRDCGGVSGGQSGGGVGACSEDAVTVTVTATSAEPRLGTRRGHGEAARARRGTTARTRHGSRGRRRLRATKPVCPAPSVPQNVYMSGTCSLPPCVAAPRSTEPPRPGLPGAGASAVPLPPRSPSASLSASSALSMLR